MVSKELNSRNPSQDAWQDTWDEYNGLLGVSAEDILGGRDPKTMTEEEIDAVFDAYQARGVGLMRQLFRPATGPILGKIIGPGGQL